MTFQMVRVPSMTIVMVRVPSMTIEMIRVPSILPGTSVTLHRSSPLVSIDGSAATMVVLLPADVAL